MVFLSVSSVIRIFIPPCDLVILLYPPPQNVNGFWQIYIYSVILRRNARNRCEASSIRVISDRFSVLCVIFMRKDRNSHRFRVLCRVFIQKMSWSNRTFFDFHLKFWYNIFTRKNKRISKRCFLSKAQNICLNWLGCFAQYCMLIPVYCFLVLAWKESCASSENAPFQNAEAVELSGDWRYFKELSRCVMREG